MKGLFGLGKKKEENKESKTTGQDSPTQLGPTQPVSTSEKKWLVQYDRRACIGSGTCAAICEKHWRMKDDGKAGLIGSTFNPQTNMFEKIVDDSEYECNKMAAEGCPPNCIHVINQETGEKLI